MIRRLLQLVPQGFRCYRKPDPIPLDADVVIVYGLNGSGKTSLFSAIEYALTGTVSHLARFSSDYPRSLQHVRSTEPGSVSLKYRSLDNRDCEVLQRLGSGERFVDGEQLPRSDAQFYRDRCYLSQNQLGRLFDEGIQEQDSDQPLVRFARDLLNLDPLENITDGLHAILDLRRLDNASESFRRLRAERDGLQAARRGLAEGHRANQIVFEQAIAQVETLFEHEISRRGYVQWTEATLRARREAAEGERASANHREHIDSLQRYYGNLETAAKILDSATPSSREQKQALRERLAEVENECNGLRTKLSTILARLEGVLMASFPELITGLSVREAERKLDAYEAAARRALGVARASLRAATELRARLDTATRQSAELQQELQLLADSPSVDSTTLREWIETLTTVTRNIHDESCPVCQRDYSELGAGTLRRKVEMEIERLGGDVRRLNNLVSRRSQLAAELAQVSGLATALDGQFREQSAAYARNQSAEEQLAILLEQQLPALSDEREKLSESVRRAAELSQQIGSLEEMEKNQNELETQIAVIGLALKVPQRAGLKEWSAAIMQTIRAQMEELAEQDRRATALIAALAVAEKGAGELTSSEAQLTTFDTRRARVEEAWKSADGYIKEARALAAAATSAKKTLLEEVFDGALNELWRDLFRRLVKADRFTPQLKLERRGRQLRTQIEGHADGVDSFDHAGSVLSGGNFNTAALSLFLSVHLLEQPRHRLLVLDDPVENIDDVHVVQLASLLRTIVFESNRQLIVGVHERALFDYLCLELGPTNASQSLLAVEVIGGAEATGAEIRADRRVWQDDKLQLGA